MDTHFIIVNSSDHRTPRLSATQEGERIATIFETESDAVEYALHLDDHASLAIVPLSSDNLSQWLFDRKNDGISRIYHKPHNGPSFTDSIEMCIIRSCVGGAS